ncbi:MAG: C-GCAxxG-C-C family (seleno)protein, partial [Thermovirgaceae bacterium]
LLEDMNCAESLIYAANDEYDLGIDHTGLKTMAGFGGGMGIETTCCGALSGAIAAISVRFTSTKAHENPEVKELCKAFLERFAEKHGEINCAPLKDLYRNERFRCLPVVELAAAELERIMGEMQERD